MRTLTEASFVLQRAAHACGLLSNQRGLLAHSYSLRLSLLNDLFLRVLPLPPPVIPNEATPNEADYATPSAAFWRRAAAEVRGRVGVGVRVGAGAIILVSRLTLIYNPH